MAVGRLVRAVASDVTPLRESPAYRRLFAGQAVSAIGNQVTMVAVPLQVYVISRSSLLVGLVGLAGLLPLVVFGLYGGAIADAVDRRRLVLITSTVMTAVSVLLLVQAIAGWRSVWLLFGCVAVESAAAAVDSPARGAIVPALVRRDKLPAANTLTYGSGSLALIVGPLLAGVAVNAAGYGTAYGLDVLSFAGAFYGAARLPPLPPGHGARRAGLASVVEGLRFVARRPLLLSSFVADIDAMLLASPVALFPAMAYGHFHGGAGTAGLLYAAPAIGALVATLAGGAIGRVRRQGLGVIVAIACWGAAVTGFGLVPQLWAGMALLIAAGAADTVSAVYRSTMMQVATPPGMQGRLQGVYLVVVTGGPRLGAVRAGTMAGPLGAAGSVVAGGLACLAGIAALTAAVPALRHYDARTAAAPPTSQ